MLKESVVIRGAAQPPPVLYGGEELPITSALPGTTDLTPNPPWGTRGFSALKSPSGSAVGFGKQCQSMHYLSLTLQITEVKSTSFNFPFLLVLVSLSLDHFESNGLCMCQVKKNLKHARYKSCLSVFIGNHCSTNPLSAGLSSSRNITGGDIAAC